MGVISLREKSYEKTKEFIMTNKNSDKDLVLIVDEIVQYLLENKRQLIIDIDNKVISKSELDDVISDYIRHNNVAIKEVDNYSKIIDSVNEYLWGYAFINKYVDDLSVSDIAIKGLEDTWIKVNGKRQLTDIKFPSTQSILNIAYSIALKNSGNLSKKDALIVLGDKTTSKDFNLRINIGIDPINTVSPHIAIRKIPKYHIKPSMDKLEQLDMFNREIKDYIIDCFEKGLNVCLCGEGGSGKTTLLNAAIEYIPECMSKLAIQQVEELSSGKKNWYWEVVVDKTGESDVEHDLQKLATNGLLLDIDWFIIGESKGAESISLFDASFTGHNIAFTTHAPSSRQALEKVVINMKKSGTDYKREELLKNLETLDVIIFLDEFKVCEVAEIEGYNEKTKNLIFNPVFKFNTEGNELNGYFERINDSCLKVKRKLNKKRLSLAN